MKYISLILSLIIMNTFLVSCFGKKIEQTQEKKEEIVLKESWHNVDQVDHFGEPIGSKVLFGKFESLNNTLNIAVSDFFCSFTINDSRRRLSLKDVLVVIKTSTETIMLYTYDQDGILYIRNAESISQRSLDTWSKYFEADRILYKNDFINFLKENKELKFLFVKPGDDRFPSLLFDIDTINFTELYNEMLSTTK